MASQPHVPERDGKALSADVAATLAALSLAEREVLFLSTWADLSYEEIARALDVPIGTVRSRLGRARAHAASVLAPHLDHVQLEEPVNG